MDKNSSLHVLVLCTWYPSPKDKLIGIYHKIFCKALADYGVKANILYVERLPFSNVLRFPFLKKYSQEQNDGYTTYFRKMLHLGRLSYDLHMRSYVKNVERLYRRYEKLHGKPDVIHAQVTTPAGYAACILGKKLGIPVVITEHATYFETFFSGNDAPYAQYALKNADRLTCVGKFMVDIFAKNGGDGMQVLPNIVDCSTFSGPKARKADDVLRLTTVCALRPQKEIQIAAAALKILKEKADFPAFRYTVVGDGHYGDFYKNAVKELGMEEYVDFVGRKDSTEIAQILSHTDILLMPSSMETFGIPAIEALAAGVPVVSTRCCGPEGFLTPECSEMSNVNDPQSFADAIERMVHRLPTMNEQAVRAVAAQFDSEAVAKQAVGIYREIIKK